MKRHQFNKMVEDGIHLIDFNARWCAPCRVQKPIVDRLSQQYRGKLSVMDLDVDDNRDLAMSFGITSIPTLSLFWNGKEIKRFIGLQSEDVLMEAVDQLLGAESE